MREEILVTCDVHPTWGYDDAQKTLWGLTLVGGVDISFIPAKDEDAKWELAVAVLVVTLTLTPHHTRTLTLTLTLIFPYPPHHHPHPSPSP